jgi:hypothetical protein
MTVLSDIIQQRVRRHCVIACMSCCALPSRWCSLAIGFSLLEESERMFCPSPAGVSNGSVSRNAPAG